MSASVKTPLCKRAGLGGLRPARVLPSRRSALRATRDDSKAALESLDALCPDDGEAGGRSGVARAPSATRARCTCSICWRWRPPRELPGRRSRHSALQSPLTPPGSTWVPRRVAPRLRGAAAAPPDRAPLAPARATHARATACPPPQARPRAASSSSRRMPAARSGGRCGRSSRRGRGRG